jgi:hypothetical protein
MPNHETKLKLIIRHSCAESTKVLTIELSIKSPSVSLPISSAFAPYTLFQWYPQSKEILLNLDMKC